MKKAVYGGSFDGFHCGHEDIIRREAKNYDQLIVAILKNPDKQTPLFSLEQRANHIKYITKDLSNVLVLPFEGLLASVCVENNAMHVIRGIRNSTDLAAEKTYEFYNKMIESTLQYHYTECSPKYFNVSSTGVKSLIKEGGQLNDGKGGNVYNLVHPLVKADIEKALMNQYFVGITGAPGTGKSFVSEKFAEYATQNHIPFHYIEMDALGHRIHDETSPYCDLRDMIAKQFPEAKRTEQGGIIPESLRSLFGTPSIHTLVDMMRPAIYNELKKATQGKQGVILIESALFAEEEIGHLVNNNVLVTTIDKETQYNRLIQRPGRTEEQIEKLLSSQNTTEEKYAKLLTKSVDYNYGAVRLLQNPDLTNTREDKKIYPDDHLRKAFDQMLIDINYTSTQ